ncbi:protein phosphatase [Favolaschia claudopus]|uniref:Protein phosphatase n=1 Tax=Favolaschia claudopus TaxID=2862362 RepID=A0AAW0DZ93_9AGAR
MGRRKIEIQPITHERNRSVTFLKRKNGLFKKAYELGVLCSVDVAVIIFEQRPGHNVKLYQYCSGDVSNIVQRHINFDGEKDTRAPADFSGNVATKLEDPADGDDDDQDDDDDAPAVGSKRRSDGSKASNDLALTIDREYGRLGPQRPPSSSLPLSGDRNSPTNKKQRIAPMLPPTGRGSDIPGYSYAPSIRSGSSSYTSPNTPYYPLSGGQNFGSSSAFDAFPGGSSRGQSQQRSGVPGQYSDYSPIGSSRPLPHRSTSGSDPFAGLLEEEGSRQTHGIGTGSSYGSGLEWPVHNSSGGSGVPRQAASGTGDSTSGGASEWMNYLGGSRTEGRPGGSGRTRESERPGSRGRVIEEYEVKKEA